MDEKFQDKQLHLFFKETLVVYGKVYLKRSLSLLSTLLKSKKELKGEIMMGINCEREESEHDKIIAFISSLRNYHSGEIRDILDHEKEETKLDEDYM